MLLIIFACFFPSTLGQSLDITPVNNENGFVLYKLDQKLIVDHYVNFLHIIDLEQYNDTLNIIDNNIKSLNLGINSTEYKLLRREFLQAKHTFKTIVPELTYKHRQKRGLINIMGSGMKALFGTMDDADAQVIFKHLDNLDKNSMQITDQLNKQVIINNNIIKNINETIKHVNDQQKLLTEYLDNITDRSNNLTVKIDKTKFTLHIYADISAINRQLEKISDTILMSKLNVLPHDILTNEEIKKYNITTPTLPFIKNTIIFKDSFLILVVGIPIFTKEKYHSAFIIPMPNNHHEELDHDITQVIIDHENVYSYDKDIISKKELNPHKNNCIKNTLGKTNTCNLKINNETSVTEIYNGLIITKNLPLTEITQNCIQYKFTIKNNNIIKFNNCKIRIGNVTFKNVIEKFTDSSIIPVSNINFTKILDNKINLKELHVNNIQNREMIKYVEFKNEIMGYTSLGISLTVIIITTIVGIFYCKLKRKNVTVTNVQLPIKLAKKDLSHEKDPFAGAKVLGDGGVI